MIPNPARISLRDLTPEQFEDLYKEDRFTISVLASRMRYVVRHMSSGLLTNAFSLILRDWYDFSATISGPPELDYPMSTVSDSLLLFMGTMPEALRNCITEYGAERLQPGDVVICNDPYRTGTHVNDLAFIRPIFHDGRIVSFVCMRAHQLDMGGVVPAGFSGSKRNVYETGLSIPPMLLYERDKPVKSAFNLIFDNCRFGSLLLPDIKSLYQSLMLGDRLLCESIRRYGIDAYLGSIRYSCDVGAEAMRDAIRDRIPDGVYEAEEAVDADGVDASLEYRVKLKLTKHGEHIECDLSGTSQQARTSINSGPLDAKTSLGVALKMLIEPVTPFSSGLYRNIDVVIPPGTLLSATPPDGAIFLYWESSFQVLACVYRALEKALGIDAIGGDYANLSLHNGNGIRNGVPWVTVAQCGGEHGPWGGSKRGDGDSYTVEQMLNNIDPATEAIEADCPVVLMRKEYAADTAGAGTHRGGAAVVKDTLWLTEAEHWSMPLHTKTSTGFGVNGGRDGALQATWMFPPEAFDVATRRDILPVHPAIYGKSVPVAGMLNPETKCIDAEAGEYFYFASTPVWKTQAKAMFRYQTCGGGGWGDPLARDPQAVKRDVRDEYVTIAGALRDYGVVIQGDPLNDPESLVVDEAATRKRREEMRAGR